MSDKYMPQAKYDKVNTLHISLKLNRRTDADLIGALAATPNKQAFIKAAIRKELENA